jgi:ATP-binding cassette subfamily B (MDR/TAP) protein 1
MTSQELKSYAKAGAIAEEVFSSIRTVFSYNGGAYESKRSERNAASSINVHIDIFLFIGMRNI